VIFVLTTFLLMTFVLIIFAQATLVLIAFNLMTFGLKPYVLMSNDIMTRVPAFAQTFVLMAYVLPNFVRNL
jgi:hypothetical protein